MGPGTTVGSFADDDLVSVLGHIAVNQCVDEVVRADKADSMQSGPIAWQTLGQPPQSPKELKPD